MPFGRLQHTQATPNTRKQLPFGRGPDVVRTQTYHALRSVAAGESGVYCGPLRLLAWEVHEKLNDGKFHSCAVPCDLITGQERILVPNARHRFSILRVDTHVLAKIDGGACV